MLGSKNTLYFFYLFLKILYPLNFEFFFLLLLYFVIYSVFMRGHQSLLRMPSIHSLRYSSSSHNIQRTCRHASYWLPYARTFRYPWIPLPPVPHTWWRCRCVLRLRHHTAHWRRSPQPSWLHTWIQRHVSMKSYCYWNLWVCLQKILSWFEPNGVFTFVPKACSIG